MAMILREGVLIVCPGCGDDIAETAENILDGMMVDECLFIGIQGDVQNGQRPECIRCGAAWMRPGDFRHQFHTKSGWK